MYEVLWWTTVSLFVADDDTMTSKSNSVSASTTMSSLGKACLELSKSIKGFRFSRQSPQDSKDAVSSSGPQQQTAAAAATRPTTAEDGGVSAPLADDVTSGVSDGATGGGSSVTSTISRVIRSATNRVRAFPSSPSTSPHHQHHPQQQQQQLEASNAVNGHSWPGHGPLAPPTLHPPPPPPTPTRTTRARYILPASNTDVWHDEQFLLGFFRYFSTMELCVLAQVRCHSVFRVLALVFMSLPPIK